MAKLWQTSGTDESHELVEAFTVGDDYLWDGELLPYDVQASKAHANMLGKKGVVTKTENKKLQKALNDILKLHEQGKFKIKREHEDSHTAIEEYLTKHCGDAGRKIHTGRSRNDQVLVSTRLMMKERSKELEKKVKKVSKAFEKMAKKYTAIPMPGYTHMQRAMPTTVGVWLDAFATGVGESAEGFQYLNTIIDQNPLGSASGFGIRNFENDRKMTTKELKFKKVQENPIYCGISRGLFESVYLGVLSQPILVLSRFMNDLLFFTSDNRGFFELPDFLTTGSSIMPQKRNVDPAEIFRGKVTQFLSLKSEIDHIQAKMLSGYNRDIPLVKGPFLQALKFADEMLEIAALFAQSIVPNKENLKNSMTEDLFITEKIYELVKTGVPFRKAYQQVKKEFFGKR